LEISLYKKNKSRISSGKKKIAFFPKLVITKTVVNVRLGLKQKSRGTTESRESNKDSKILSEVF